MTVIDPPEDLWGYAKRLRFVRDAIDRTFPFRARADVHILDVGCGTASMLGVPLARLGYSVTGIDMHEPSINDAAIQAQGLTNATFLCGSIEDLGTRSFELVLLSEVLEHVVEPQELLTEAVSHLAEDGIMIVTVPNGYGEFEWDSWLFRKLGLERLVEIYEMKRAPKTTVSSTLNAEDRHIQFFTLPRIREIFGSCGLTVVSEAGSTLMAGPFIGHTLARSAKFIEWNSRIADKVPMTIASGWYFLLRAQ